MLGQLAAPTAIQFIPPAEVIDRFLEQPWLFHNGAFRAAGDIGAHGGLQLVAVLRHFVAPVVKNPEAFLRLVAALESALQEILAECGYGDTGPGCSAFYGTGAQIQEILLSEAPENAELAYRLSLVTAEFRAVAPRSEWRTEGVVGEAEARVFMEHFAPAWNRYQSTFWSL